MRQGLRLYNLYDAERTGAEIPLDTDGKLADVVFDEMGFRREQLAHCLFATDMDGTMFRSNPRDHITGDIGVLVFLEKVQDPKFWDLTPEKFEKLLLPRVYREYAQQQKSDIHCQAVLNLVKDLCALYRLKKEAMQKRLGEYTIGDPDISEIVREFAFKMIHLDEQTKTLEGQMTSKGLGVDILMRTRFFAGKKPGDIRDRTRALFERSKQKDVKPVDLGISQSLTYPRVVEDLPDRLIRPVARINAPVRDLVVRMSAVDRVYGLLVTMNLVGIAKTAVQESDYCGYIDQIQGGRLQTAEDTEFLGPEYEGGMFFGPEKSKVAERVASEEGKSLICAMGDTVFGDGDMLVKAVQNGGIAIVTGADLEKIQRDFTPFLRAAGSQHGIPHIFERTFAVTYS